MYKAKDYSNILGIEGFSDELLKNHFKLYEGYVVNTNKTLELLDSAEPGTSEYSELQRRFGWEWNGMRLHELYFGNMKKDAREIGENLSIYRKVLDVYGSVEDWKNNFTGVGAMRGIGWVVLYYDKESGELFNAWIDEHNTGHFSGAVPLLVMDVFEHAFMLDYGMARGDYIKAFMSAIDWEEVEKRFTDK